MSGWLYVQVCFFSIPYSMVCNNIECNWDDQTWSQQPFPFYSGPWIELSHSCFQTLLYKTLALQVTNFSPFDQSEATFEMSCGTVAWIITFSVFWYDWFLACCYVGARYTRWLYHVIQFLLVGYITSYPCFPRFVCGVEAWIPRAKPILHTNYKVPMQVRANTHI